MKQSDHKFSDYFLIGLFLIILFSAFIQQATKIIPETPNQENRKLADEPVFAVNLLDPFPAAYEKYYNDHFVFRNHFVNWYAQISFNWFGISPYPEKVIIGKNNQLYLVPNELDTYQCKNLLTEAEITIIRKEFIHRNAYYSGKGVDYYMVICPTKYSVYPEYLPWFVRPDGDVNRTDQFIKVVRETGVEVVDLRKALLQAKDSVGDKLFWPTDNHWSELGAFLGYQEIIRQIQKKHPEVEMLKFGDFDIRPFDRTGGNLASMLNMQNKLRDSRYKFIQLYKNMTSMIQPCPFPFPQGIDKGEYFRGFEMQSDSLPHLLFIHDSFGKLIHPFMKDSFSRSVFIWDNWQYKVNEPIVEAENPDICVTMTLESLIGGLIKNIN
ncbi:MAG: hypothetical protein HOO86_11985 [Bacteroidales bacterium]|nr:hypothetical protein [Bacteroidales bacterium]